MRLCHYLSTRMMKGAIAQTQGKPTDHKTDTNNKSVDEDNYMSQNPTFKVAKKKVGGQRKNSGGGSARAYLGGAISLSGFDKPTFWKSEKAPFCHVVTTVICFAKWARSTAGISQAKGMVERCFGP